MEILLDMALIGNAFIACMGWKRKRIQTSVSQQSVSQVMACFLLLVV